MVRGGLDLFEIFSLIWVSRPLVAVIDSVDRARPTGFVRDKFDTRRSLRSSN